jgi:hypothetical protein
MKPLKTLLCISFMLSGTLMGSQAVATDASGQFGTVGAVSCASFLREFEAKSWEQVVSQGWLAGYITAFNYQTPKTYQILGNSDLLGAELWVKNFCEKNPLKNIAVAAGVLMIELYPTRTTKAPN